MVPLEQMRASNAQLKTAMPAGLVAVFAGATSGIGESSLRQFVKNTVRPRIYFLGRSKESGARVSAELKRLNPDGEYHYLSVDVSSIKAVDKVSLEIKEKEQAINLLFLSIGTMVSGKGTLPRGGLLGKSSQGETLIALIL
jgi:NADP-dependent 3-hydroxy acid dehydrogenase YdfG